MTAEPLPAALRRDRIAALVHERGFIRVAELSNIFRTSPVTIRTDLDELAERQLVRRVHGGAVPTVGEPAPTVPVDDDHGGATRRALGAAVAGPIRSGQTIVLAAAPTTRAVARALAGRAELTDLQVVTNDLRIALELQPRLPSWSVIVTGGTLRSGSPDLGDPLGGTLLDDIGADVSIAGCAALSARRGLTAASMAEVEMARRLLRAGDQSIVVAEGDRIGAAAPARVARIDEIHRVVTESAADADAVAALRTEGVEVEQVTPT